MRKIGNIILFFISCVICLYTSCRVASIFDFHNYLEEMVEKEDCQQIYYSVGGNDLELNEITSFIQDNETIKKFGQIDGVKVQYPYTSITNTLEDDWTKAIVDVKINGKKLDLENQTYMRMIPYYPEDGLDPTMKKVFVSDGLWYHLDLEEGSLPVNFEGLFYMPQYEEDLNQNRTKITYQKQWLTFEIHERLENYYSTLHEEGYLILVPYPLMKELCNNQFESQIIYLNDVNQYKEVISKMEEINDDFVYYCGREYYENFLDDIFTSYDLPEFFLFLVLTAVVIFLDFKYIFRFYQEHHRQGYFHWLIGFMIALLVVYPAIYYRETLPTFAVVFAIVLAFVQKRKNIKVNSVFSSDNNIEEGKT